MSVELAVELLGSQLVRAVAGEIATTLANRAFQHAVLMAVCHRPEPPVSLAVEAARPCLRALPTVEVLSWLPGRARLRVRGARGDAARAEALAERVRALPGVGRVEANPLTGTLLVRFDPGQIGMRAIIRALEPPRSREPRATPPGERTLRLVARGSA